MLQSMIVLPVFSLIGWCIWTRRHTWRMRWHQSLTLAVALQGVGFFLCVPIQGEWLGPIIFNLTGVAHLRDYVGHLCFMAAAGSLIYTVATRLLPARQVDSFMRRLEVPGATAAVAMLACMMSSPTLRHRPCCTDFFQMSRDGWLVAYWIIYMGICGYLLLYLVNLLFVLREDPRNRVVATLFITAVRIGFVAIAAVLTNAVSPGHLSSVWIWVPLCISSGLAAVAGAWPARGWLRGARSSAVRL